MSGEHSDDGTSFGYVRAPRKSYTGETPDVTSSGIIEGVRPSQDSLRRVHLFDGSRLLASRLTSQSHPDSYYNVNGTLYQVISRVGPVLNRRGVVAWDLQVVACRVARGVGGR